MSAPTYLLLLQYQAAPYVHHSGPASGTLLTGPGNGVVLDSRLGRVLSLADFSTTFEGSQTNWRAFGGGHTDTSAARFAAPVVSSYSGAFNINPLHALVDDYVLQVDVVSSPSAQRQDIEVYLDLMVGPDTYEVLSSGGNLYGSIVPGVGARSYVGQLAQIDPSGYTWRIVAQRGSVYFLAKPIGGSSWVTVASTPMTAASLADRRTVGGGFGSGYWDVDPVAPFPDTIFDNFLIRESYSVFTAPATVTDARSNGAILDAATAGSILDRASSIVIADPAPSGVVTPAAQTTNQVMNPANNTASLLPSINSTASSTSFDTTTNLFATEPTVKVVCPGTSGGEGCIISAGPFGGTGAPASPGDQWTASAYVKGTSGMQLRAELRWGTSGGGLVGATDGAAITCTGGWQRVYVTGTAPASTGTVTMKVLTAVAGAGTFWVAGPLLTFGSTLYTYTDPILDPAKASWTGLANKSPSYISYPATYTWSGVPSGGVVIDARDSGTARDAVAGGS